MNYLKILFAAMISVIALQTKAQTTDFSGTWKVNKERSDAGDLSINSIPIQLVITQDKESLSIERTSTNVKAEIRKDKEVLKLDGSIVTHPSADSLIKAVEVKWSADGKALTETASYTNASGKIVRSLKKTWTLNGNLLHIVLVAVGEESYQLDEYFDKQ